MKNFTLLTAIALLGSVATLSTPSYAFDTQPDEGGETKTVNNEKDCAHQGAEMQPAMVMNSGAVQCPSASFELNIGVDGVGGQVSVKWSGCPSFLDTQPAHGKKVQKPNHNPVGPQTLNWTRQEYKADCGGWFSNPSCTPKGSPTNLPTTVNHWQEEGCPLS